MNKSPVISIIFALAISTFATRADAGAGWTEYTKLAELVATSRHYYSFRLELAKNPSGCREGNWFYQDYTDKGADKIFDALLEALSAPVKLRVYVTGVCNIDGYAEISSLGIVP